MKSSVEVLSTEADLKTGRCRCAACCGTIGAAPCTRHQPPPLSPPPASTRRFPSRLLCSPELCITTIYQRTSSGVCSSHGLWFSWGRSRAFSISVPLHRNGVPATVLMCCSYAANLCHRASLCVPHVSCFVLLCAACPPTCLLSCFLMYPPGPQLHLRALPPPSLFPLRVQYRTCHASWRAIHVAARPIPNTCRCTEYLTASASVLICFSRSFCVQSGRVGDPSVRAPSLLYSFLGRLNHFYSSIVACCLMLFMLCLSIQVQENHTAIVAHVPPGVVDSLRLAEAIQPALESVASALSSVEAADRLVQPPSTPGGIMAWTADVIALLGALEPQCMEGWAVARRALLSVAGTDDRGEVLWDPVELLELVELADLVDICGQGNRAAPHARDLVGQFFRKSVEQGRFFGDVRMSPKHFDELVALATPHLPIPSRCPSPIHPTYRIFAVLFWLAQGGRQRVIARAVDVAESTFSKHCAPVVAAMLADLPKPVWPDVAERRQIGRDFARLTGGNASGWAGLYVNHVARWKRHPHRVNVTACIL